MQLIVYNLAFIVIVLHCNGKSMFLHLQMQYALCNEILFLICVYFFTHFNGEKINFSHQNGVENSQALVFLHGTNKTLNNFLNFFQECRKKNLPLMYIDLLIDFLTFTTIIKSTAEDLFSYLFRPLECIAPDR